jgi:2-octaprenyl-6-methoxyphenol hydroxylase
MVDTGGRRRNGGISQVPRRTDIAVVGAGPVGLAAAIGIADAGYRVTLVAPRAPADRRTSALLAGSVRLLEELGVWQTVADEATPLKTLRIIDGTRRLLRFPEVTFAAREIDLDAFGYNIANTALIAALDAAVSARPIVRVDALVERAAPGSDEAVLNLSNGEPLAARLIVAADGRRSRVRDSLAIPVTEWRYDQTALVCDVSHTQPHRFTSTEFHTEGGPFTFVPLAGNRSSLVWVDRPGETRRRLAEDEATLAAEIEACSGAILGAITLEGARQSFPIAGMNARRFGERRVVLAGEAAHLLPPIGAQGLNLGYRDVAALRCLLVDPGGDPGADAVTAEYDRARRTDVTTRTTMVDALNRTLLSDFLPVQALRGLGLFLLDSVPALRRFAMRQGVAAA